MFLVGMACNKVQMETRRQFDLEKRDLRRDVPLNRSLGEDGREIAGREPSPIDVAIARERWERILRGHPVRYRRILQLRLQGHTHAEIAKILGLKEPTVYRFFKNLLQASDE
jgi:DNA-directed RNA polymerase specialized sigma24 family protein